MRHVMLIGTSHKYQLRGTPAADAFRTFIEQVCATKPFRAIAEDMSLEGLTNRQASRSVCEEIAIELGLCHRYCDPDNQQRSTLGIRQKNIIKIEGWLSGRSEENIRQEISTSHSIREQCWLDKLLDLERWPVLFVCGACHIESFGRLAEANGLSVDVAAVDWEAG